MSTEFVMQTLLPLYAPVPFCDKIPLLASSYSVVHSRNTLVQQALDQKADYILWIDSDMVVDSVGTKQVVETSTDGKQQTKVVPAKTTDPNLALKALMDSSAPFASGLYKAKQQTGFNNAMWKKVADRSYTPIMDWTGNWIEADVVGLGFTLTRREIYEKMPKPWFHWDMPDEISEDFYFCEKVRALGYQIRVFTDLRLRHLGEFGLNPDGSIDVRRL